MHPVAFHIGAITVSWYGLLVAAGFIVGLWTASRRGMHDGLAPEKILDLGPWLIVGALIGARAFYVISFWNEQFANEPLTSVFMFQRGGLVFYGGLVGATLATILWLWMKGLPILKFGDVLAPSVALGYGIGRLGCMMYGCCYGRPSSLPWAIHFPLSHPTEGRGVHPTQIYEALAGTALYAVLAVCYRRKRFDGQILALYLMAYPLIRAGIEFFRGDYSHHYFGMTPGQLTGLGAAAAGLVLYALLPRRAAHQVA